MLWLYKLTIQLLYKTLFTPHPSFLSLSSALSCSPLHTASAQGSSSRLVTCITTLHLFCKIRASLLLRHATTLHPYLNSKCSVRRLVWLSACDQVVCLAKSG